MTTTPLTFRVSPNSVLTPAGLQVNGSIQPLRHQQDFVALAFVCGAAVGDVLATVFPNATAIPLPGGEVQPSAEASWSHYSRHLISLKVSELDSPQFVEHGKTLLQWCVAAVAAARMLSHPVMDSEEYLPVEYLAHNGGAALACSLDEWTAHLEWLGYTNSPKGLHDRMEGEPRRDPRPPALSVTAPWPGALGAKLGAGGDVDSEIFSYATDILSDQSTYWLSVHPNRVMAPMQLPLREQFDALVLEQTGDLIQYPMMVVAGGKKFFIRASRDRAPSGKCFYCFRMLRQQLVDIF